MHIGWRTDHKVTVCEVDVATAVLGAFSKAQSKFYFPNHHYSWNLSPSLYDGIKTPNETMIVPSAGNIMASIC